MERRVRGARAHVLVHRQKGGSGCAQRPAQDRLEAKETGRGGVPRASAHLGSASAHFGMMSSISCNKDVSLRPTVGTMWGGYCRTVAQSIIDLASLTLRNAVGVYLCYSLCD